MIAPFPHGPSDDTCTIAPRPSYYTRIAQCLTTWICSLLQLWSALHISYRGSQYSVERLLALEEYTRNTSLVRVVLVFASFPVPATAILIAQEAVPLQNPNEGWKANYGFWVRAGIICGAVFYTILVQIKYFFRDVAISRKQICLLVVIVSLVQTTIAAICAAYVFFPIPFCVITLVPSYYVVMVISFLAVVGVHAAREITKRSAEFVRFIRFIGAQQLMAVIYPAYEVLFRAASDTEYEVVVVLLLPIVKLIVKNVAFRCVIHMEDMMPEAVIFTVDFFNALYLATSMENASSHSTVAIIILLDLAQTSVTLYRLHRRTSTMLTRMKKATWATKPHKYNLLNMACYLCRSAAMFRKQSRQRVRIRSCIPHYLSANSQNLINRLEIIPCGVSFDARRPSLFPRDFEGDEASAWSNRRGIVAGGNIICVKRFRSKLAGSRRNGDILRETLEILFTIESLALSASLDAMVPLFYANFLLVMVHLPSARYHTELESVTTDNIGGVVHSVFLFALVQIITFWMLGAVIYRNFGTQILYHVTFVLETQRELIQSKLVTWVLMTMAFRVVHFGVDFTFRFLWLSRSNK